MPDTAVDYDAIASQFGGKDYIAGPEAKAPAADYDSLASKFGGKDYVAPKPVDYDALASTFGGKDVSAPKTRVEMEATAPIGSKVPIPAGLRESPSFFETIEAAAKPVSNFVLGAGRRSAAKIAEGVRELAPVPVMDSAGPSFLRPAGVHGLPEFQSDEAGLHAARGVSDIISGIAPLAAPAIVAGVIAAPVATAVGLGVGAASKYVASAAAKSAGVRPEYANLIGDIAMLGSGALTSGWAGLFDKIDAHNAAAEELVAKEGATGKAAQAASTILGADWIPVQIGGKNYTVEPSPAAPPSADLTGSAESLARPQYRVVDAGGKIVKAGNGQTVSEFLGTNGAKPAGADASTHIAGDLDAAYSDTVAARAEAQSAVDQAKNAGKEDLYAQAAVKDADARLSEIQKQRAQLGAEGTQLPQDQRPAGAGPTFETRAVSPEEIKTGTVVRDKGGREFTVATVNPTGRVTFKGADGETRVAQAPAFAKRMVAIAVPTPAQPVAEGEQSFSPEDLKAAQPQEQPISQVLPPAQSAQPEQTQQAQPESIPLSPTAIPAAPATAQGEGNALHVDKLEQAAEAIAPNTTPVQTPPGPQVPGPDTGFGRIGEMGAGITDSMYAMLWDKVQTGDVTEAGAPSAVLQGAKLIRDAGGLRTPEEFTLYTREYASIPRGQGFQRAMGELIGKFSPKPQFHHQVTQTESGLSPEGHRAEVVDALRRGEEVPAAVRAEYPDVSDKGEVSASIPVEKGVVASAKDQEQQTLPDHGQPFVDRKIPKQMEDDAAYRNYGNSRSYEVLMNRVYRAYEKIKANMPLDATDHEAVQAFTGHENPTRADVEDAIKYTIGVTREAIGDDATAALHRLYRGETELSEKQHDALKDLSGVPIEAKAEQPLESVKVTPPKQVSSSAQPAQEEVVKSPQAVESPTIEGEESNAAAADFEDGVPIVGIPETRASEVGNGTTEHHSYAINEEPRSHEARVPRQATTPTSPSAPKPSSAPATIPVVTTTLGKLRDDVLRVVAPAARSKGAREISYPLREMWSELSRRDDQALAALRQARKMFASEPREKNFDFINRIETGQSQKTLPRQVIADVIRTMLDRPLNDIRALGTGQLQNFYENYFPHAWKDPAKAVDAIAEFLAKRPMQGPKSFLKKRTMVTFADGIKAGLEPVSDNPVDLVLAKIHEENKYLLSHVAMNQMKARGQIQYVDSFQKAPAGYQRINDAIATVFGKPTITISEAYDKEVMDRLNDLAKSLGIRHTRKVSLRSLGKAHNPGGQVETKFGSPESVLAHEIGHQIEYKYGISKILNGPGIAKELRDLADLRFAGQQPSAFYKSYVRGTDEKMANAIAALVYTPELFKDTAPQVWDMLRDELWSHPELRPIFDIKPSLVLATNKAEVSAGGLVIKGAYWAREDRATIVNNSLSPGIRGRFMPYDLYMGAGNLLNQAQLGFSAFHLGTTAMEAMISRDAMAVRQLAAGRAIEAAKSHLSAVAAPFTYAIQGDKMLKEWMRPGTQGGDFAALVDAVVKAGGRANQDKLYETNQADKIAENFAKRGWNAEGIRNVGVAALRVVPAIVDLSSRPLMRYYIPRLKLGAFADLARFELSRLSEGSTAQDAQAALSRAWDSIDNRLGQLVYDNLFWDKTAKDLAMASVRAVGWNVGSLREVGGALLDTVEQIRRVADRGGTVRETAPGSGEYTEGGPEPPQVTNRMAYLVAGVIRTALMGGLLFYLLTGKTPQRLKDYFFPLGHSMPGFLKDMVNWSTHPWDTAASKVHPMIPMIYDNLTNTHHIESKRRGISLTVPITKAHWDEMKRYIELGQFDLNQTLPISIRNVIVGGPPKDTDIYQALGMPKAPLAVRDGE